MQRVSFFLSLFLASHVFASGFDPCDVRLSPEAPTAPPPTKEPPAVPRPSKPEPETPTQEPGRRPHSVPVPLPGPLWPTEEPLDIRPESLYSTDDFGAKVLAALPDGLRDFMRRGARQVRADLEREQRRYVAPLLPTPAPSKPIKYFQDQFSAVEREHGSELISVLKAMVQEQFGADIAQDLRLELSDHLPPGFDELQEKRAGGRKPPAAGPDLTEILKPHTEQVFWKMAARREFYQMLVAAHGWKGMAAISEGAPAQFLNQIQPHLADTYRAFGILRRRAYAAGDLHFGKNVEERKQRPSAPHSWFSLFFGFGKPPVAPAEETKEKEIPPATTTTIGRAVVKTWPYEVFEDGVRHARFLSVQGHAVGMSFPVLALEAYKAAFQMATAFEKTQWTPFTPMQRWLFDQAIISWPAEFRQLIFGTAVEKYWRKVLEGLFKEQFPEQKALSEKGYLRITERFFILPLSAFFAVLDRVFDPAFTESKDLHRAVLTLLHEHDVLAAGI